MGAVTNFITYYIIGVPLIVYLALYGGLGVIGIWIGLAVADFIQVIMLCQRHAEPQSKQKAF